VEKCTFKLFKKKYLPLKRYKIPVALELLFGKNVDE
jgi:hypothetical protein